MRIWPASSKAGPSGRPLSNVASRPLYVPPRLQPLFEQLQIIDRGEAIQSMADFLYSYTKVPTLEAGGARAYINPE
jgi:hypothetical protein